MAFAERPHLWGIIMWKKTTEATGRAWKFDNKYIWAAIFLIGNALGYSVPATLEGIVPFAYQSDVLVIEQRVDVLEDAVFGAKPEPKEEEQPVEPEPTPEPVKKHRIKVEGY